jgi:hypothetical protein
VVGTLLFHINASRKKQFDLGVHVFLTADGRAQQRHSAVLFAINVHTSAEQESYHRENVLCDRFAKVRVTKSVIFRFLVTQLQFILCANSAVGVRAGLEQQAISTFII